MALKKTKFEDNEEAMYEHFVQQARTAHSDVATDVFAADMQVELVNDGPVTIPMRA